MNKRLAVFFACVLIAVVAGLVWCNGKAPTGTALVEPVTPDSQHGAAAKEQLLARYIDALNKKDEQALGRLIPEDHEADEEVAKVIEKFGGHQISDVKFSFRGYVNDFAGVMSLSGRFGDTGTDYKNAIAVSQEGTTNETHPRWYLIMGCVPPNKGGTGDCTHPNFPGQEIE